MKRIVKYLCTLLCLSILFTGCAQKDPHTIRIATSGTDQNRILTEILALMLEEEGVKSEIVEVEQGIKSIHPAMEAGEFDVFCEKTGEAWNYILKKPNPYTSQDFEELKNAYLDQGLTWQGMQNFKSVDTLAIRKDLADKLHILTLSDLKKQASNLVLGTDKEYMEREDGLPLILNKYGITFGKTICLDPDLMYINLKEEKCDLIPINNLDGRLSAGKMKALEDNLNLLPKSSIGYVARQDVLMNNPKLAEVLKKLEGAIELTDLQNMNKLVSNDGVPAISAARSFLEEKGFIDENN